MRYQKFKVYNDSKLLYIEIIKLTSKFPNSFNHLSDQVKRASLSVALNIAEGSAKHTDKEFRRYIGNSLGSITEVLSCCEICCDLNLISKVDYHNLESKIIEINNQLGGLYKKLGVSS